MKKLTLVLVAFAAFNSLNGCNLLKKDSASDAAATDTGSGVLTAADLAGNYTAPCTNITDNSFGTLFGGGTYSFYKSITLTASNTYSLTVMAFKGATNCMGGQEVFAYSQAGVYSVGTPLLQSGESGIMFTSTLSYLTVYGGTSGGGTLTFGNGWVTSFNTGCPGGPTFTSGSASSNNVGNVTCNTNGMGLPQFPPVGTVFYDAIAKTASGLTGTTPVNFFLLGQYSTFPMNGSVAYTKY